MNRRKILEARIELVRKLAGDRKTLRGYPLTQITLYRANGMTWVACGEDPKEGTGQEILCQSATLVEAIAYLEGMLQVL